MSDPAQREERKAIRLGYATNAFPGETLDELAASLAGPLARIGRQLDESEPLGVEVRLSATVAESLASDPAAVARLSSQLDAARLEVITFNGFSPSDFHARLVKEDAYRPTWLEEGRARYTRTVAELFARLLPEGASGSLSTSPGSFKAFGGGDELLPRLAEAYARMAHHLADIEERLGRRILLSVEPEPGCTIETTQEFLQFYERDLLTTGLRLLAGLRRCSPTEAERLLRRHIAFTFDTAHLSVEYEDLVDSARRIARAGIRIGKVHATSAVRVRLPARNAETVEQLGRFTGSPYMHQCLGVDSRGSVTLRTSDLAEALDDPEAISACEELRVHFHLPLNLSRLGTIETTSSDALAAVRYILGEGLCETVILETYTWQVLERFPGLADHGVEAAVAEELRWARNELLSGVETSVGRPLP